MLHIRHIAKNVKIKVFRSQFHGDQDYVAVISHIKKNARSCKIATHFIDECCDDEIPFKYLVFDMVNIWFDT